MLNSGEKIKIDIFLEDKECTYRISTNNYSSPIKSLGNINTKEIKGDLYLHNNEILVVNTDMQNHDAINKMLMERISKYSLNGQLICVIDMTSFYEKVEENFIKEAIEKAQLKLDYKMNYYDKYEQEKEKNKSLKNLLNKYITNLESKFKDELKNI